MTSDDLENTIKKLISNGYYTNQVSSSYQVYYNMTSDDQDHEFSQENFDKNKFQLKLQ